MNHRFDEVNHDWDPMMDKKCCLSLLITCDNAHWDGGQSSPQNTEGDHRSLLSQTLTRRAIVRRHAPTPLLCKIIDCKEIQPGRGARDDT
ncbi:hypothetical protein NPIL_264371 [Nephila pilipes]|uniref:Uncharacterized protein n=1 Tax=Nephila pilipes TaxID=299642 RepID=A0A8X6UBB6_NEPPI|nr:hypothetical protein NPIL_264371 [Nephila pilipes]